MNILNKYIGYKLICKMSKEFKVIFREASCSDSGYIAIVSDYDDENEAYCDEGDGEAVAKNLMFGNWDIIRKEKV